MSIICTFLGHKWTHLPDAVPEDRETFFCQRCGDFGFRPARVLETEVPEFVEWGAEE